MSGFDNQTQSDEDGADSHESTGSSSRDAAPSAVREPEDATRSADHSPNVKPPSTYARYQGTYPNPDSCSEDTIHSEPVTTGSLPGQNVNPNVNTRKQNFKKNGQDARMKLIETFLESCASEDGDSLLERIYHKPRDALIDNVDRLVTVRDQHHGTILHYACKQGNIDVINLCHKYLSTELWEEMVVVEGGYGLTALHVACKEGQSSVVYFLRENMKPYHWERLIRMKDHRGRTAFSLGCRHGHAEVVKELSKNLTLKSFCRLLKVQARHGLTALHLACLHGHTEVLTKIYEKIKGLKGSAGKTGQGGCTYCGYSEGTQKERAISDACAWVTLVRMSDYYGDTALHLTCHSGHTDVLEKLHQYCENYDIDLWGERSKAVNEKGQTALWEACDRGHVDIIKKYAGLVGPDLFNYLITLKDCERQQTMLDTAVVEKSYDVLAAIISSKHMFKTTIEMVSWGRVMIDACEDGEREAVRNILSSIRKADHQGRWFFTLLTGEDSDKEGLLHIACKRKYSNVVREILSSLTAQLQSYDQKQLKKVEKLLCQTDDIGRTLLHECCQQDDHETLLIVLEAIRKFGKDLDLLVMQDKDHKTPFWYAFERGNCNIVQSILLRADPKHISDIVLSVNDDKETIVHRACHNKYDKILCLETVMNFLKKPELNELRLELLKSTDRYGRTFLSYISDADEIVVKFLISTLTDSKQRKRNNNTTEINDGATHVDTQTKQNMSTCLWLLTHTDKDNKAALHYASNSTALAQFMEAFFEDIKDDSIEMGKKSLKEKQNIKIKGFDVLKSDLLTDDADKINTPEKATNSQTSKKTVTKYILKYSRPFHYPLLHIEDPLSYYNDYKQDDGDSKVKKTPLSLLKAMGDSKCLELINHKYTDMYLQVCWRKFVRQFFAVNLTLYLLVLLCLTMFVASHEYNTSPGNVSSSEVISPNAQFTDICQYLLLVFTFILIGFEVIQIVAMKKYYWRGWRSVDNYVTLTVCVCSLTLAFASMSGVFNKAYHQLGIAIMIVAWLEGARMMTKVSFSTFQPVGIMFTMLFDVMWKTIVFLPVLAVFILTMALSYTNLLQEQQLFSHLGFSILRSMVMTIGELDQSDIFFPEDPADTPPYYVLTAFVFVLFLGIMNICVMNLLVGMAVGDIHELKSNSKVIAFRCRVDLTMESAATYNLFRDDLVKGFVGKLTDSTRWKNFHRNSVVPDTRS